MNVGETVSTLNERTMAQCFVCRFWLAAPQRCSSYGTELPKYCSIFVPVDEEPEESDNVNHPSHYTQGGIECIECIRASMPPEGFQDYCKGNVMKYIFRWREKGGIEDLKKARVYLDWMIESAETIRTE